MEVDGESLGDADRLPAPGLGEAGDTLLGLWPLLLLLPLSLSSLPPLPPLSLLLGELLGGGTAGELPGDEAPSSGGPPKACTSAAPGLRETNVALD